MLSLNEYKEIIDLNYRPRPAAESDRGGEERHLRRDARRPFGRAQRDRRLQLSLPGQARPDLGVSERADAEPGLLPFFGDPGQAVPRRERRAGRRGRLFPRLQGGHRALAGRHHPPERGRDRQRGQQLAARLLHPAPQVHRQRHPFPRRRAGAAGLLEDHGRAGGGGTLRLREDHPRL